MSSDTTLLSFLGTPTRGRRRVVPLQRHRGPGPAVSAPSAAPVSARRFRPDIQGLRAVAVLLVVLYHADFPGIRGGYVGVDVFFVISGFLITQHLDRELAVHGRISLLGFYGRRARRLLPPAALVVLVTLVVGRFTLPYAQIASLVTDASYTAFYGINYHLALDGVNYQNAGLPPSPLQHYWSLAVEEQFYVIWPLLMIICAVIGRRRGRRPLLVAAISALTAVSLYLSVTTTATDSSMAYFGLQTRAWELGAGALLALTAPFLARTVSDTGLRLVGWAGLAAVVGSGIVFTDRTQFPGVAALVPVLGAVSLIAAGVRMVPSSVETKLLSGGVAQHIGKTSYAWYLWHWPMLILLPMWWGRDLQLAERLEVALLAYWVAVLTYFLENASARSLWRASQWVVAGLFLSTVMISSASLVANLMPNLQGTGAARESHQLASADLYLVQAAINSSFVIDKLPANLTPTLAKAPNDYPWEQRQSCFNGLKSTAIPACVYGDPKGKKVAVLVGDSHAEQWLDPLGQQAKAHGWKLVLFGKGACPVAELPVFSSDLHREYTECSTFQDKRAKAIARLKPDLVIGSEADPVGIGRYTPHEWASATVKSLQAMHGRRTVYIGDSPYMGYDGLGCLEKNVDHVTACIYPRVAKQAWTSAYDDLQHATTRAGFGFVDTVQFFCNSKVCPPIVNNMVTHRDQGHVTRTYAVWLAPMFAPIFETKESK